MTLPAEIIDLIATLSEERNAYKRNYDLICDDFKIPQSERLKPYVPEQIMERIRTYLTGYIARRSLVERENGSAFTTPPGPAIVVSDPNLPPK